MGLENSDLKYKGRNTWFLGKAIWLYYAYVQQYFYFVLGILFALFSFVLVLGQMSIFWHTGNGNNKENLVKSFFFGTGVLSTNIAILLPLAYISACTFYGLFKIKILGLYSLNANQQTDAFSLVFSATIITRLIPVMCYNFLQLVDLSGTVFEGFMGTFTTINIWSSVSMFIPYLLMVLIFFNIFNVWRWALKVTGLQKYMFIESITDEKAAEGRKIVRLRQYQI